MKLKKKQVLVILEASGKVKTVGNYLKNLEKYFKDTEFQVTASGGHIRQIPSKPNSITFDTKFHFSWETDDKKVKNLLKFVHSDLSEILLATDQDREGEAISYHLKDLLKTKVKCPINRISFCEITEDAVKEAIENKRDIDMNLVSAYFNRIGIDYELGFKFSPILWKNMPDKNQSFGRVQSPTICLMSERNKEIVLFKKQFYFTINLKLKAKNLLLTVDLEKIGTEKFVKFDKREEAEEFVKNLKDEKKCELTKIDKKKTLSNPSAPFITSTLQQEASTKLGYSISETMKIAQSLYEGVTINDKEVALTTYIRTDSTNLNDAFVEKLRTYIKKEFDKEYLSSQVLKYKTKVLNSQEAHEAIRSIDLNLDPNKLIGKIDKRIWNVYKLVWQKTLACQMSPAIYQKTTFNFKVKNCLFKNTVSFLEFPGYLAAYDKEEQEANDVVPDINENTVFSIESIEIVEHETSPPSRYSEGSLVKALENHGIGRPSTYVSIVDTLLYRQYIIRKGKALEITLKGLIVSFFFKEFFDKYVNYGFTASIEKSLDEITSGNFNFEEKLKEFCDEMGETVKRMSKIPYIDCLNAIENRLKEVIDCTCKTPSCNGKNMALRSKFSFFFVCETCGATRKIVEEKVNIDGIEYVKTDNYQMLKVDNKKVYLPKKFNEELDKEKMNFLLTLPIEVGKINDKIVLADMGPHGFYLKYNNKYKNIKTIAELQGITQDNLLNYIKA